MLISITSLKLQFFGNPVIEEKISRMKKVIFPRNFSTIIVFIIELKLSDGKKPKYAEYDNFVQTKVVTLDE